MVPVTILTGFLGAGKTTLLKRILSEPHGQKIAVIENEFGPESIDNELLVQDSAEQIIELSNGCVCCSIRGDLQRTLKDLAQQREQGSIQFDRVVLETTGMANPGPVCQTFFMVDDIAQAYRLDAVITVVDAKHGMQTLDTQEEAQKQVGFADIILVSKKDMVEEEEYQALRARLVKMNPRSSITPVHFGQADISQLLDVSGFNLNTVLEIDPAFLAEQHPDAVADEHSHEHHEHGHQHEHHHAHHDDSVSAFVFRSSKPFDADRLESFLGGVIQVYGSDMLRYKGILFVKGSDRRVLFQGVHMLMGAEPGKPWQSGEKPATKLVFIGRKLPQEIFTKGLEQCLA